MILSDVYIQVGYTFPSPPQKKSRKHLKFLDARMVS